MKKRTRIVAVVLISSILITVLSMTVFGALPQSGGIMPMWDSINSVEVYIDFNGTTCMPGGIAIKQSTATSLEGTLTVYEEVNGEWEELYSWYKQVTRGTLALGEDFEATSGVRYKAVFEVTAYTGTTPETVVFEDIGTCP